MNRDSGSDEGPPGNVSVDAGKPSTSAGSGVCLNCGLALSGAFCSHCGQRSVPAYPSMRELALDAFQELSGWDGRLATTIRTLIARPGILTREFLEGRRARYISPLRLYLLASLAYFVVAAGSPEVTLESGKSVFIGVRGPVDIRVSTEGRPRRVGQAAADALRDEQMLIATREEALADIASAPALLQPVFRKAIEDPAGLQRAILAAMPRMLFVLLPIFAAIVALLYRGRKYPEHLYFAVHLHAFMFSALLLLELLKFTRWPTLVIAGAIATFFVLVWYAVTAFRRVYGESLARTLAKGAVIAVVYGIAAFVAFSGTLYVLVLAA